MRLGAKLGVTGCAIALALACAPSAAPAANFTLGGTQCTLIAVPAASPVGTPQSCAGVRPGAIVNSQGGQCTLNFVFDTGSGDRYVGTAGHCIIGGGEASWKAGDGPAAYDANGNRIGEFAYAVLQDPKDFALIRLDGWVPANGQMCHFGGPTGINGSQASSPVVLNHFGNGAGFGSTAPGRSAVALGMPNPDHVFALGAVVPGDSGSGVESSDGRAVGVVVTTGFHSGASAGADTGTVGITRLAPQVARAEQVLGVGLWLRTAGTL